MGGQTALKRLNAACGHAKNELFNHTPEILRRQY